MPRRGSMGPAGAAASDSEARVRGPTQRRHVTMLWTRSSDTVRL